MSNNIEIPVWIGEHKKWITGLNSKTTCHDIIYALLSHTSKSSSDMDNYAIFESWRGIERQLPGRTKISKVWKAWGGDCENVTLTLRAVDLDTSCEVSHARQRVFHKSKRYGHTAAQDEKGASLRTQRDLKYLNRDISKDRKRSLFKYHSDIPISHNNKHTDKITNKASVKCGLAKMNCIRPATSVFKIDEHAKGDYSVSYQAPTHCRRSRSHGELESGSRYPQDLNSRKGKSAKQHAIKQKRFQKVLHLILSQEKKIREQLDHLKSMDNKIMNQERKQSEMKQDIEYTLPDKEDPKSGIFPALKANDLEAYSYMCETIIDMDNKVHSEQARISDLSTIIREETFVAEASDVKPHLKVTTLTESRLMDAKGNLVSNDELIQMEIQALNEELKRASDIGKTQQEEMERLAENMAGYDKELEEKNKIINNLLHELGDLNGDDIQDVNDFKEDNQTMQDDTEFSDKYSSNSLRNETIKAGVIQQCVAQAVESVFIPNGKVSKDSKGCSNISNEVRNKSSKFTDLGDMYTETVISDVNSVWDEDSLFASRTDFAPRERVDSLPSSDDGSASSGFCDLASDNHSFKNSTQNNTHFNKSNSNNNDNIKTASTKFFPSFDTVNYHCRYVPQDSRYKGLFNCDGSFIREVETIV